MFPHAEGCITRSRSKGHLEAPFALGYNRVKCIQLYGTMLGLVRGSEMNDP